MAFLPRKDGSRGGSDRRFAREIRRFRRGPRLRLGLVAAMAGLRIPYESLGFWLAYGAAVIGCALLVHAWYERPMRRLLRRRLERAPLRTAPADALT